MATLTVRSVEGRTRISQLDKDQAQSFAAYVSSRLTADFQWLLCGEKGVDGPRRALVPPHQ